MKADNVTFQNVIHSPNRYLIPVFQRYYSWGKKEWNQLWENLIELREEELPNHFMGAIVFVPDTFDEHTMPTFQVIDGQQRIITMSLLMCALRNLAKSNNFPGLADEITHTCLLHPYKNGVEKFRVYPRQRDRDEYMAVIDHEAYDGPRSNVTGALIYFSRQIQALAPEEGLTEPFLRELFEQIKNKVQFVYLTLDEENPYRIFKSLNSTGMNLSEADLIRNFILMSVSTDSTIQDKFDDAYWRTLEMMFADDDGQLDSRTFSTFFRDFLMASGKYVPMSSTFYYFERRFHQRGFKPKELVLKLTSIAELYNMIRGLNAHPEQAVNRALHRMRLLNTKATYPLALNLLMRLQDESISVDEFTQAAELVYEFVREQLERDEFNRPINRWLVRACRELGHTPIESLARYFESKRQK